MAIAATVALGVGSVVLSAHAEDRRDERRGEDRRGDREDHDRRGYYYAPPVVYGSPCGYGGCAPPPVVYGPGVGIMLPGIMLNIH